MRSRVRTRAFERLERHKGKLLRAVLRGLGGSNASSLPGEGCSDAFLLPGIKVKGVWMYLYRAVDSDGNTVEFMLSCARDAVSAKRFFRKALRARHTVPPRVINVDRNPSYPKAVVKLKKKGTLPLDCELRPIKYLNNLIEQDHRFIKRRVNPGMGFWSFDTAWRTLQGYEAMHQLRKGQVQSTSKGDINSQVRFVEQAFGLAS